MSLEPNSALLADQDTYADVRRQVMSGQLKAVEIVSAHTAQTNIVDGRTGQLATKPIASSFDTIDLPSRPGGGQGKSARVLGLEREPRLERLERDDDSGPPPLLEGREGERVAPDR